jgi:hypothetical protein
MDQGTEWVNLTIQVEPSRAEMVLVHDTLRVHHTWGICFQLLHAATGTDTSASMDAAT